MSAYSMETAASRSRTTTSTAESVQANRLSVLGHDGPSPDIEFHRNNIEHNALTGLTVDPREPSRDGRRGLQTAELSFGAAQRPEQPEPHG